MFFVCTTPGINGNLFDAPCSFATEGVGSQRKDLVVSQHRQRVPIVIGVILCLTWRTKITPINTHITAMYSDSDKPHSN